MHRMLFRQHRLQTVVATAHRCAVAGLMLLGVALCGVAVVTFNAGFGVAAGGVEGFCTAVAILAFWSVYHYSREDSMTRQARFSSSLISSVFSISNLRLVPIVGRIPVRAGEYLDRHVRVAVAAEPE